jgi:hypothetical protein
MGVNALNGLTAALTALFTPEDDEEEPEIPAFSFRELTMKTSGLGGFVGESRDPDPAGDILARRLDLVLAVSARSLDRAGLAPAAALILNTLLAADRARLAQLGLHHISLDRSGDPRPPGQGETQFVQDLFFKVRYEFIQAPQAAGDRIEQVDVDVASEDHHEAFIINEN